MIKVIFDLVAKRIELSGEEGDLLKVASAMKDLAPNLKEIVIRTDSTQLEESDTVAARQDGGGSERAPLMRQWIRKLSLPSVYDKIAALAYYANKYDKKQTFAPEDMKNWFGLCGFQHPKQKMSVVLVDARRFRGYIESKGRAQWALTTAGENIVLQHLEKSGGGA